jgi:RimJ/RimL family protein N-acetyltransferase
MCPLSGFIEEGREREAIWMHNQWHDSLKMGILRREWEAGRAVKQQ